MQLPPFPMEDQTKDLIQSLKTDEQELEEVLGKYDLDQFLEDEYNAISDALQQLEIRYQSLLNTRKYLTNG